MEQSDWSIASRHGRNLFITLKWSNLIGQLQAGMVEIYLLP